MSKLFIYCDGGARGNPGPAATGFVVKNSAGQILVQKGQYIGKATNNVAEYRAVIAALEWIADHPSSINFFLDSKLVVNQLKGLFKIKNKTLQSLVITIKKLERKLSAPVVYFYIPREKNKAADSLVNDALDKL